MGNKVQYGLEKCFYAVLTETQGVITYGTPKALLGAVNLSLDAEGEETNFRADNTDYFKTSANNGYSGSLELAKIPKDFLKDCLGQEEDDNGAVIENKNNTVKRFALMFQFEGDETGSRVVLYDCVATRPKTEHSTTEETITPQTETIDFKAGARTTDGQVKACLEKTVANEAVYNDFYNQVYEKQKVK